jgi:hypothetical protein
MALRDWIAAFPIPSVATTATLEPRTVAKVATVATVAVAAGSQTAPVADPFADFAAAFRSGVLQQCHACRHFTDLIPTGGDILGVPEAGWCLRYHTATHPLMPFWCDGYSPTRAMSKRIIAA